MLWVRHRIRQIKNQTSDEEIIKKRSLEIKEKMKKMRMMMLKDQEMEMKMKGSEGLY